MILIHYGDKSFDPNKFKPIENIGFVKPRGGLWTSPIDSNWGWKDWCHAEDFRTCKIGNSFTMVLKSDSKVLKIDSLDDLKNIPFIEHFKGISYPDFEKISESYDAIWLTENGQIETRFSSPQHLYGWDCESVLILNPESILCFTESEKLF
jgi:hypothetical protein